MSNDRPKGSYSGPLSLQWCAYSMTVRAMPMNYLAADLSRIDAALWGRESEIGAAIAEAPAMVEALRWALSMAEEAILVRENGDDPEDTPDICEMHRAELERHRAILSRIDGAGPPLSAYAETVTDAEYREIANGRAPWPLKGASGDGAGDTLPDAPVPHDLEPAQNGPDGHCLHCGRDNTGHEGEPCADDCPQYWEAKGREHPQHPTGEEPYALKAARGYASNPEQWNPPSPEQMAEILAMIDRKATPTA